VAGLAQRRTIRPEDHPAVLRERVLAEAMPALAYPLGWVAALAAVAGAILTPLLRLDPFANPDSHAFEAIARSLLAGRGFVYHEPMFPSLPLYAFRSVGYSAFLALFLSLGVTAVVAVQGALHGVGAALLGDIARRLAGKRAAWIAFAMALVWPYSWYYAGQLLSESLVEFALISTLWLAMEASSRRSLTWASAAGVMATIAMFTRPTSLGPAVVLAGWLALRFPRGALVMALAAFLAWLPWPIRNYVRLGAFVPFQTMGGVALYDSHSDQSPDVAWAYMAAHSEMGELGLEHHFMDTMVKTIRDDPKGLTYRLERATIEYMGPILDRRPEMWFHRFALLALLPALVWSRWRRRLALPVALWSAFGALLIPIVVNLRYRFPMEWCVVLGAAIGIVAAWERWGGRRTAALAAGALAAAIAFSLVVSRV
jgi:hypothetical protein